MCVKQVSLFSFSGCVMYLSILISVLVILGHWLCWLENEESVVQNTMKCHPIGKYS